MPGLTARDAATDRRGTDGRLLRAVADAAGRDCGAFHAAAVRATLAAHDVEVPPSAGWYEVGRTVDVCEALLAGVGPHTIERLGRRVPAVLDWPQDLTTVGQALAAFPAAYDAVHDGDVDGFAFDRAAPGRGTLSGGTPYPDAFERGMVRGIGDHFGGDEGFLLVGETWEGSGTTHADERVYDLQWPRTRS